MKVFPLISAQGVSKFLKTTEKNSNRWLHKLGLTRYRPGRAIASNIALLAAGSFMGLAVALAFAPKSGKAFRQDVKKKTRDILSQGEKVKMLIEEARA